MPDVAIVSRAIQAAPKDYKLAAGQNVLLKAVKASYDGSGAAAAFLPALQMLAPDGTVMWTAVDPNRTVAAGGSADASWFPHIGSAAASAVPTQVYEDSGTVTVPATSGPGSSFQEFFWTDSVHQYGSPIFDTSTLPTTTPTVVSSGVYALTMWARFADGQGDLTGNFAYAEPILNNGALGWGQYDVFELIGPSADERGQIVSTAVDYVPAGETIQAIVGHWYTVGSLNYDVAVLVVRVN